MTTYVLVHGGRHGGWCWRLVAAHLRAEGHEVFTPTLTGLGERAHLLRPDVGLATHVDDVAAVIECEELTRVVLVGHSYGGMVISGAAARCRERISRLVYLDAIVPRGGEALVDLVGPGVGELLRGLAAERGTGWLVPSAQGAADYGVTDPETAAWVDRRLSAQTLKTYVEPLGDVTAAWELPGVFVDCLRKSPTLAMSPENARRARERAAEDPRFAYVTLDAPHDCMVTHPDAVAALLSQQAPSPDAPKDRVLGSSSS